VSANIVVHKHAQIITSNLGRCQARLGALYSTEAFLHLQKITVLRRPEKIRRAGEMVTISSNTVAVRLDKASAVVMASRDETISVIS
jgi:hypothetical protein